MGGVDRTPGQLRDRDKISLTYSRSSSLTVGKRPGHEIPMSIAKSVPSE